MLGALTDDQLNRRADRLLAQHGALEDEVGLAILPYGEIGTDLGLGFNVIGPEPAAQFDREVGAGGAIDVDRAELRLHRIGVLELVLVLDLAAIRVVDAGEADDDGLVGESEDFALDGVSSLEVDGHRRDR